MGKRIITKHRIAYVRNKINESRCVKCNRTFYCIWNCVTVVCSKFQPICYCPECYYDTPSREKIEFIKTFRFLNKKEAIIKCLLL